MSHYVKLIIILDCQWSYFIMSSYYTQPSFINFKLYIGLPYINNMNKTTMKRWILIKVYLQLQFQPILTGPRSNCTGQQIAFWPRMEIKTHFIVQLNRLFKYHFLSYIFLQNLW